MNTTKSDFDTKVFFFTRRLSPYYCFGAGGPREETSTRRHIEEETPPPPPKKGLLAFKDRETIKTREQKRRWFFEGAEFSTIHTLVEIFFCRKRLFDLLATFRIQKKTKKSGNLDAHKKLNSRYSQKSRHNTEEDAPRSLSHSQKECARTKERQKKAFGIGDRWCFCCFCWWW